MIIKHKTPNGSIFTIELERDGSYSIFNGSWYVRGGFKSLGEATRYIDRREG